VYIITYEIPDSDQEQFIVKIGLAISRSEIGEKKTKGLQSRLDSYLLYWPLGVIVFAVFVTRADRAKLLERAFHDYVTLKKRFLEPQMHSHTSEWAILTKPEIYSMIEAVMSQHKGYAMRQDIFQPPRLLQSTGKEVARREVEAKTPENQRPSNVVAPTPNTRKLINEKVRKSIIRQMSDLPGAPAASSSSSSATQPAD
jgi:hypothetical protein